MLSDIAFYCFPARYKPAAWVSCINWSAFEVCTFGRILTIGVGHTDKPFTMPFFIAITMNIIRCASIQIADEKFEISIVVRIDLHHEIDLATLLPCCHEGDHFIRDKSSAEHVIISTFRIPANTGTIGHKVEIGDGIKCIPTSRW